ncbi:MAG: hypothetical protein ACYC7E_06675 [Armatimonadota bacterium]
MISVILLSFIGYMLTLRKYARFYIEHTPLFITTSIICIVYLAGLLGQLHLAAILLFYGGLLLLPVTLYQSRTNMKEILTELLHPGVILYAIAFIAVWVIYRSSLLEFWDEYAFWGLVPKEMYIRNSLLGESSTVFYKDYPPGTAIFQYYITQVTGFSDSNIIFAQIVLFMSALVSITRRFVHYHPIYAIILTLFISFVCCSLISPMNTLYVDLILATYFGISLFLYFSNDAGTLKKLALLFPVIFILPLIKNVGIFLVLIVIIIIATDLLIQHRNSILVFLQSTFSRRRPVTKINIYSITIHSVVVLIFLALPFLSHATWKCYMSRHHIAVSLPMTYTGMDTWRVVTLNGTQLENSTTKAFITTLFNRKITRMKTLPISVFSIIVLLFIIAAFSVFRMNDIRFRLRVLNMQFWLLAGFVIYTIGLLMLYQTTLTGWQAATFASFERYINIYLTGWLLVAAYLFINRLELTRWVQPVIIVIVVAFILFIVLKPKNVKNIFGIPYRHPLRAQVAPIGAFIRENTPPESRVYLLWQQEGRWQYEMLRYEIVPRIPNYWCFKIVDKLPLPDDFTAVLPPNKLAQDLLNEQFQYMYIGIQDSYFWTTYGHLFDPSLHGKENQLCKIERSGSSGIQIIPYKTYIE